MFEDMFCPMLYDMFVQCLKTCLLNLIRQVYLILDDVFTNWFKTWLASVWRIVYPILKERYSQCLNIQCLKTSLPDVWSHLYLMSKDIFTQYLKISLPNVWSHVSPKFEDMISQWLQSGLPYVIKLIRHCLKTCFSIVRRISFWGHVYPMCENMCSSVWKHLWIIFLNISTLSRATFQILN